LGITKVKVIFVSQIAEVAFRFITEVAQLVEHDLALKGRMSPDLGKVPVKRRERE